MRGTRKHDDLFVAISRFRVANGMEEEVRAAFRDRPHLVEDADGFVRLEVLNPTEASEEFWLLTWWTDEESFRRWHRSHLYRDSHSGIPKGLKLDASRTRLEFFRSVAR
jgi:heme oxygenase (mycobilin-producing)